MKVDVSDSLVSYEDALSVMEDRVALIRDDNADDLLWLLEHPPLYTAGTSAKAQDLLNPQFPVYESGRGGQYTYHGPGQRVAYVMMDLKKQQSAPDVKKYVWQLEDVIIRTLQHFDVTGQRRDGRIGIWVETPHGEQKIAAIGVRIRHWVTFHGLAINVCPDLSHFGGIVPCGLSNFGVTSLQALHNKEYSVSDIDEALKQSFADVFKSNCV